MNEALEIIKQMIEENDKTKQEIVTSYYSTNPASVAWAGYRKSLEDRYNRAYDRGMVLSEVKERIEKAMGASDESNE